MEEQKNNIYNDGKIYFLMNNVNHEIFYIGSTIRKLKYRLSSHIINAFDFNSSNFDSQKSNYIRLMNIDNNKGIKNISIHLIENYPCNSKEELLSRERYWIEIFKPSCNTYKPITTLEEKKEYMKKYNREYKINNNYNYENRKEYFKKYEEDNKERRKKYKKKYNEEHKEKIKKYL